MDKIKTLVLEDEPIWAKRFVKKLTEMGFEVTHVSEVRLAVEAIKKETFDLICVDLLLPDSTGPKETLTAITSVSGYTPVIAVTSVDSDWIVKIALSLGVEDFMVKGEFDPQTFVHSAKIAIRRIEMKATNDFNDGVDQILVKLGNMKIVLDGVESKLTVGDAPAV